MIQRHDASTHKTLRRLMMSLLVTSLLPYADNNSRMFGRILMKYLISISHLMLLQTSAPYFSTIDTNNVTGAFTHASEVNPLPSPMILCENR
jgi:hypothetical protein